MDTTTNNQAAPNPVQNPAQDPECEKMVLASMLTSYECVAQFDSMVDSECFANQEHREIWEAIHKVYQSGDTPDIVSVSANLAATGSKVSNAKVIDLCIGSTISHDIGHRVARLKDLALRRKIFDVGMILMSQSSMEVYSTESIYQDAKKSLDNLCDAFSVENTVTLSSTYQELQQRMLLNRELKPGETLGTPTGFPMLDMNGGLNGTDLIIVGAETSQGKTSFATALTLSAIKHNDKVAFYSMEMAPWQLAARIASMESGISSSKIMYKKLEMSEIYTIDNAVANIGMENLFFDSRATSSLDSVLMSIRQMHMKHGIKGAVIDYLQLVRDSVNNTSREQFVAKCARDLKNLAKDLGIWIIAISQLRRDQTSTFPTMARLRDSGQIEEAADNIYLIYRPGDNKNYPDPFSDIPTQGTAMISIGKGRHTGIGEFVCGFKAENTLFYPLSDDDLQHLKSNFSYSTTASNPLDENLPF